MPGVEQRIIQSAAAKTKVSYHVYVPKAYDREKTRRFPVLYWLHGSGGGGAGIRPLVSHFGDAIRKGKVPPMLVVFPNGLRNGMWCDSKHGKTPVETILMKEVIPDVDANFRTIASREGRMVEGFSMGGYGAARIGFKHHDLFSAVSILGGGPLQRVFSEDIGPKGKAGDRAWALQYVFGGDQQYFKAQSPWVLAQKNVKALRKGIRIRIAIGGLDRTLPYNRDFHKHLNQLGIPHSFTVPPRVKHNPQALLDAMGETNWEFYCTAFGGLPQGEGFAADYPGDRGIEKDQAVLFAEDFEGGALAKIGKRWDEVSNKAGKVLALSDDVPPGSSGKRSIRMTGTLGENSGGHLFKKFRNVDKAFLRFYTRFAQDHAYEHHFVALGGHNPPTRWPNPKAGTCPRGDDRVHVFIDPVGWYGKYPPPGVWNLYTYWAEMKKSADGKYWGNCLQPARQVRISRGKWICVELMVQLNSSPDRRDGELALWIDGKPVLHVRKGLRRGPWSGMGFQLVESGGTPFKGLRLRTSSELKLNYVWLEHYIDPGAQRHNKLKNPNKINSVWFDHVVVATRYIGPIAK
jgi:S-formylglutathione hydrolase FrmB